MSAAHREVDAPLLLGEFRRTVDDRFRITLPQELHRPGMTDGSECVLAKERAGALSLWPGDLWKHKFETSVSLIRAKIEAGRLTQRFEDVQSLGRLLSTRHRQVELAGKGRLLIPEGFREFLGVPAGGDVILVGAAVCVEIWEPAAWIAYLESQMPEFARLLNELST